MTDPREALVEVAYMQIATEKMLTVVSTGPGRAKVPLHWRAEAEERARPWIDAILAAGWAPRGERVKPSVEGVARALYDSECYELTAQVRDRDVEWALIKDAGRGDTFWHRQARAILALLPGRTETEVKAEAWEYGLVNPDALPGQYGRDDTAHLVGSRDHIAQQHRRGHPAIQFVRRRRAGKWEVVSYE